MKLVLIATLLTTAACADDAVIPTVNIVSASPDALVPTDDSADDLTIVVRYRDPDGDLGGGIAEIHDCRAGDLVTSLDIPPIASADAVAAGVAITGMLQLVVADIGDIAADRIPPAACADADAATATETAFCVILRDSADNPSDPACTAPIAITPPPQGDAR